MRLSTSAAVLALGAAASAALEQQQQQIVLGNKGHHEALLGEPQFAQEPLGEGRMPTHATEEQRLLLSIGGADADAATAWDAIRDRIPHADFLAEAGLRDDVLAALRTAARGIPPKPVTRRRHDSEWDYVMHGSDVQAQWVDGATADAPRRRKVGGHLESYKLRAKKVDPSKLGVDDAVKQYSGYLDDNEKDKHLFYWFFESRNDPKNDPVVLWLNGGPGCSSLTGLFAELGPSMIRKDGKIHPNPYSWNSNASVIFLDQPVNVGYSYSGSSVSSTVAAGRDVYALLTLFFEQFPEYATQPFHIAGESYAGHYIPVFASEILSYEHRNINLKSVLIGNGLTDGLTQYAYYRPMACGEGGYPARLQPAECESMDKALPRCQSLIESCYQSGSVWSCVPASIYCNNAMIGPYQRTGFNVYDIRSPCEDTSSGLCYLEMKYVAEYLNEANVRDAVGAEVDSYDSCNMDINRNFLFAGDWFQPFHRLVPAILEEHKLPVLVYAGDADYICNWLGNQAWTNQLDWAGQDGFAKAEIKDLKIGSHDYGKVKSDGKLTFMQIYQAGHMVPMNQPEASLDFVNRWLGGEWAKKA